MRHRCRCNTNEILHVLQAQKQQLEAELAQTKAALKRAQAASHSPSDLGLSPILASKYENKPLQPIVYATGQVSQAFITTYSQHSHLDNAEALHSL